MVDNLIQVLPSIGASALLFLALWYLVGVRCLKPFFDLLEEREAKTIGDESKAKEINSTSSRVAKDIESELSEARIVGVGVRDEHVARAKEQAATIINASTQKAQAELEAGRSEIEQLKTKARADLAQESAGLAQAFIDGALKGQQQQVVH